MKCIKTLKLTNTNTKKTFTVSVEPYDENAVKTKYCPEEALRLAMEKVFNDAKIHKDFKCEASVDDFIDYNFIDFSYLLQRGEKICVFEDTDVENVWVLSGSCR